jgi:hypothetical protein
MIVLTLRGGSDLEPDDNLWEKRRDAALTEIPSRLKRQTPRLVAWVVERIGERKRCHRARLPRRHAPVAVGQRRVLRGGGNGGRAACGCGGAVQRQCHGDGRCGAPDGRVEDVTCDGGFGLGHGGAGAGSELCGEGGDAVRGAHVFGARRDAVRSVFFFQAEGVGRWFGFRRCLCR